MRNGQGRGKQVRSTSSARLGPLKPKKLPVASPEPDSQRKDGKVRIVSGNTDVLMVQLLNVISTNLVEVRDTLNRLTKAIEDTVETTDG